MPIGRYQENHNAQISIENAEIPRKELVQVKKSVSQWLARRPFFNVRTNWEDHRRSYRFLYESECPYENLQILSDHLKYKEYIEIYNN